MLGWESGAGRIDIEHVVTGASTILKAVSVTFVSTLVTIICHFLTLMMLIRLLEPPEMGVYFIAVMVVALLVLIGDLGIDLAFVKQYPEHAADDQPGVLRAALLLRSAVTIVVTLLFLALTRANLPVLRELGTVVGLVAVLYWQHTFRMLLLRLLQVKKLFSVYAITQGSAAALKVLLVALLFALPRPDVFQVLIIENVAFAVSVAYAVWRLAPFLSQALRASSHGTLQLMRFGSPLYMNSLVSLGNDRASGYIVAAIGGPVAVAFYSVAERLADAGRRLFVSFTNVYLPMQTGHFAANDIEAAKLLANRSLVWIVFIIASGTIVFAAFRELIIELLFTAKYVTIATAAVMFFVVLMVRTVQVTMGYFSVAAGLNYLPLRISLVSSAINIAMTIILFRNYGYEGAATALILTQALMSALYFMALRRAGYDLDLIPMITVVALFAAALAWVFAFTNSIFAALPAIVVFPLLCLLAVPSLRTDTVVASARARQAAGDYFRRARRAA